MIFQKIQSTFKEYVWGGRKLAEKYGKDDSSFRRIAESWESCEWLDRLGFQLKWIDTDCPTSIQVHPGTEMSDTHGFHGESENEIWVVVESEPASRIGIGFRQAVSRDEILDTLHDRTLELLLNTIRPEPGDCFVIPAGTIHYIDGGVTLLEWKPKDGPTLRLYDWGRSPTSDRVIQVADSLAAAHHGPTPFLQVRLPLEHKPIFVPLGNCTLGFGWHRINGQVSLHDGRAEKLLICLEGVFSINHGLLQKGETVLVSIDPEDTDLVLHGNGILLETIFYAKGSTS